MPAAPVRRNWLQFGLWTLLLAMTLAGAGAGYMMHERRVAAEQQKAVDEFRVLEYEIGPHDSSRSRWLLLILDNCSAAGATHLSPGVFRRAYFPRSSIPENTLARLPYFARLRSVDLSNTTLDDSGLRHLGNCAGLETLNLRCTNISDNGLRHLSGLSALRNLDLTGTRINDAGLAHLQNLTKLERLDLTGTNATSEGIAILQEALPSANIVHFDR